MQQMAAYAAYAAEETAAAADSQLAIPTTVHASCGCRMACVAMPAITECSAPHKFSFLSTLLLQQPKR